MIDFDRLQVELDYYQLFLPRNYHAERNAFFRHRDRGKAYCPVFEYAHKLNTRIFQEIEEYLGDQAGKDPVIDHFLETYRRVADLMQAWVRQDLAVMTRISGELFGDHRQLDWEKAHRAYRDIRDRYGRPASVTFTAKEIGERFLQAFAELGMSGWRIDYQPHNGSELSIYEGRRTVVIKEGIVFDEVTLERVICHEIVGHAFQALNALTVREPCSAWLSTYLGTEKQYEGYAVFSEINRLAKKYVQNILLRYLLLMIATKLAADTGFDEVYRHVYDLCDDTETAFFAACKAKRGFADTSQKGCFQKENAYLCGALTMCALVDADPRNFTKTAQGVFPLAAIDDIPVPLTLPWRSIDRTNRDAVAFFRESLLGCIQV